MTWLAMPVLNAAHAAAGWGACTTCQLLYSMQQVVVHASLQAAAAALAAPATTTVSGLG